MIIYDINEFRVILTRALRFEMTHSVCEFHITCHLSWALGGGATNSTSHHVLTWASHIAETALMG